MRRGREARRRRGRRFSDATFKSSDTDRRCTDTVVKRERKKERERERESEREREKERERERMRNGGILEMKKMEIDIDM